LESLKERGLSQGENERHSWGMSRKKNTCPSVAQEVWQRDVEQRNIGAEWRSTSADEVESEVELTRVGHTDTVSRRNTVAD
jgi:hypothetical protein